MITHALTKVQGLATNNQLLYIPSVRRQGINRLKKLKANNMTEMRTLNKKVLRSYDHPI